MIKLKTKQLLDFMKLSSVISTNDRIIPIHGYIRLKSGTLSKTNGRIFLSQTIDAPDEVDVLLEENSIMPFVKFTKDEEIELLIEPIANSKNLKVVMKDKTSEGDFQSPPSLDFDKLPIFDDAESVELNDEMLLAIGIASKQVDTWGGGYNPFDFIHLHNEWVIGCDTRKLYAKKIPNLPDAYLDSVCATVISQFNNVKFNTSGKYNLFQTGGILYGFQQYGDIKYPVQIDRFLEKKMDGDFFEFEASELISYCEWVNQSIRVTREGEVADCVMSGGSLECVKQEYGKGLKKNIEFTGDFTPHMKFNPKLLSPFLRSLGVPTIRFHDFGKVGVFISDPDDKNFIGMIAGIA